MAIALSEFWTRLMDSGIADAEGCKRLASRFCDANGGSPPADAVTLAKFLLQSGAITEFQARSLLAGRELRFGSYLVCDEKARPPLSRWRPARPIGTSRPADEASTTAGASTKADGPASKQSTGLLFVASAELLAGGRDRWLEAHCGVTATSLQPFEVESRGEQRIVFSPLPAGKCLRELVSRGRRLDKRTAVEIGLAVAEALAALRDRSLAHGAVRTDRVWIAKGGRSILLRDPSGPPTNPLASSDPTPSWIDDLERGWGYAAPELAQPDALCSPVTDLYSLGCLLYRLAVGKLPFQASSRAELLQALADHTPPELSEAVRKGETGDPFFRVVAFAMAKNPEARFQSTTQLIAALKATLELIPERTEKQPPSKKSPQPEERSATPAASEPLPTEPPPTEPLPTEPPPTEPLPTEPPPTEPVPSESVPSDPVPLESVPLESPAAPPVRETAPAAAVVSADSSSRPQPTVPPKATVPPEVTGPATGPAVVAAEGAVVVTEGSGGASGDPARTPPTRRRKKKKSRAPLVLGGLCVPILILVILVIVGPGSSEPEPRRSEFRPPAVVPSVTGTSRQPSETNAPEPAVETGFDLVDDDRLLWVPPYRAASPAPSLMLLPPGPGVIATIRVGALGDSADGKQIIEAFSPEVSELLSLASSRAGVPLDQIGRCSVALHPGNEGWPEVSLAIELEQPRPLAELTKSWNAAASRTRSGATIYAGDDVDSDAYYIPPAEAESDEVVRFAVGSVDRISEVAENEGGQIPLPRLLQSLWNRASGESDLVLLVTPNFLFADAREILPVVAPELVAPLKAHLIPDAAGAMVTADLVDSSLYAEVRLVPSGGVSEPALLRDLRDSIEGWPDWADRFVVESVPDASWRLLANRLPFMMRFVSDQARFGISDGAAVANVYLPVRAASQVSLAVLLAMNTSAGAPIADTVEPVRPLTVEEMLNREMSVAFDQESLEFAIDTVVDEFRQSLPAGSTMPPVRIIGGDLEKGGITQNQQIRDFSKSDQPLRTVLTDIVVGANPDKTATGPDDPKQALIWVVAEDPQAPGETAILITTRKAAAGVYELPAEFVASEPAGN